MIRNAQRFAIALACAWLGFAGLAQAATRRIALLIGSNEGSSAHRPLRFAEADAAKLAGVLTELGGVQDEDLLLLRGPSLSAVRAGFREAQRRVQEAKNASAHAVLVVFFSGHSDGVALELGDERLTFSELREFMEQTQADVRVAIVDSCKSGALLAAKGGTSGPAFELRLVEDESSSGQVLLTSSAADEQALESREIGGSIFTHHFVSGLRGAADTSGDGKVTLTEAYEYAFARTVRQSADTLAGVQHPSFDYRLSGQGDLVLTETSLRSAQLSLPKDIDRALVIDERRDRVVAETSSQSRALQLAPGTYRVRVVRAAHTFEGRIELAAGERRTLDASGFQRLFLERAAGKGDGPDAIEPVALTPYNQFTPPPPDPPQNALTIDPLHLFVQTLSLRYTRVVSPRWTLAVTGRVGVIPDDSPLTKIFGGGSGTTVFGGSVGASFFPGRSARPPGGFFLGPSIDVFRLKRSDTEGEILVPSFELGYSFLFDNGFMAALAGGVQYAAVLSGDVTGDETQLGFFPRVGVRLGCAF